MPDSKHVRKIVLGIAVSAVTLISAAPATATPVATNDAAYAGLGRVFPDPMAGCQHSPSDEPCSPNAQGNIPALQFIQFGELQDALRYMNQDSEWQKYMEVWPLDTGQFPGNTLSNLEFTPSEAFRSAGLPTSDLGRKRSDLYVVRVTDESVPDAGKKRYALSLSIHGIERAGAEGGTRAMEDLVTAFTTGLNDDPIVPDSVDPDAPTFEDVLKDTIIYFTYPNPDGWRRGSATDVVDRDDDPTNPNDNGDTSLEGIGGGGVFFQRYNGNGVDPNRDWPDIGYSYRGYSGGSEPETRAFQSFYEQAEAEGGEFAAGDDLHGMPFADALSYTMLPHGSHDFAKDQRIRDAAEKIHAASEAALLWSPAIQADTEPHGGGFQCIPNATVPLGDKCVQMYGQTWGTVYDTINYTTTGTLGDWYDSNAGLGGDGISNEMSFSHLDKNIVFDPHTEQLHVDGNKALIYAHIDNILNPPADPTFEAEGAKGYVANPRVRRAEQSSPPSSGPLQAPIDMGPKPQPVPSPEGGGTRTIYDASDGFHVDPGQGGFRVDVTSANAQGIGTTYPVVDQVRLRVECICDDHHGPADLHQPEWTVVAEDYNQKQLYLSAGLTAAVNNPQATNGDGSPTQWRIVVEADDATLVGVAGNNVEQPTFYGATKAHVEFTSGPATSDGSGTDRAPRLAEYDVANTDFLSDLNRFSEDGEKFDTVDPDAVLGGEQDLSELDTLVLADNALPGYRGLYGSNDTEPIPPPNDALAIESQTETIPAAHQSGTDNPGNEPRARVPGSFEVVPFTLGAPPERANKSMKIQISLANPDDGDFDMTLYKVNEDGSEDFVGNSGNSNSAEEITVGSPEPGDYKLYVDNWLATGDTHWFGDITFVGFEQPPAEEGPSDTGAYTAAEKDQWTAKLREFAEQGGNLVLTDGALQALPDLVPGIKRKHVIEQAVYVGQVAFSDGENDTTDDPLAEGISSPGSRFNTGMRRQTYEPTPLGFAIQDEDGGDQSNSPQYDVDRTAWEEAGGRYVAGSANSGTRNAQAVYDRVTIGEIEVGDGQIRIIGSLLPQPSNQFDHPLGVEPHAVTYTGYMLAENLFDWRNPNRPDDPGPGPGPGPGGGDQTAGSDLPSNTAPVSGKAKRCKKKARAKKKKCKKRKTR